MATNINVIRFILVGGLSLSVALYSPVASVGGKAVTASSPAARCNENTEGTPTDLAGTYSGSIAYSAKDLSGNATLEVGPLHALERFRFNRFSITAGTLKLTGRIISITTCGYTTVTMFFDHDAGSANTSDPPTILSLRACKSGRKFSLSNATTNPSRHTFSFCSDLVEIVDTGRWGRGCEPLRFSECR